MKDFYEKTKNTYKENFEQYISNTPPRSPDFLKWREDLNSLLTTHSQIIEIGSMEGIDARYFREKGHIVLCTDIVPEMLKRLANDNFMVYEYDFQNEPKKEWLDRFDCFFANAVLLHAEEKVFQQVLKNAIALVKKNGIIALTFKEGFGDELTNRKMNGQRYFKYYKKEDLEEIFKKLGFSDMQITDGGEGKYLRVILINNK